MAKQKKELTLAQRELNILKPIPEDKFTTGKFTDSIDSSKHCAKGHLCLAFSNGRSDSHADEVVNLTEILIKETRSGFVVVNDNKTTPYLQDTPKKRVIALLKDMIKKGY